MKTVKVAGIHNYGGAEVVRIEDASLPELQAGELLIRIRAAGVNSIDWKIRAGYLQRLIPLLLPFTLGGDFSGVVEEVGAGVAGFKVGDEVYGQASVVYGGSGSFAELSVAKAVNVSAKPRSLNHTEAAALPLSGVSAWQALTEHLRLRAGQKVLIHGGAGGIGSLAIQIAKHLGAYVVTTVSVDDIEYVKVLGADEVINYRKQKFEQVVSDLDAVFDTVGGETYVRSFRTLKRGSRMVSLLEQPRQELNSEYGVEASFQFTQVTTERLTKLAELVDRGALRIHVAKTFSLKQAGAALLHVETALPKGKVVLTVG